MHFKIVHKRNLRMLLVLITQIQVDGISSIAFPDDKICDFFIRIMLIADNCHLFDIKQTGKQQQQYRC